MTIPHPDEDLSNGWEAVAPTMIREARLSTIGVALVTEWADQLPPTSTVLDLGCGPGGPRSDPLHTRGRVVYAIDASPSLARAYHERYPGAHVACEAAEGSPLFGCQFDGVLSWGLLFLLPATVQEEVIQRVSRALKPGARFLFTAPWQAGVWADNSTSRESVSLGAVKYRELLAAADLALVREYEDEGDNHYYETLKR
jgi:SAM-dependent methyltransferase